MSKPADRPRIPLTDREYAYLRISGPGNYEAITQVLRLDPSEAWNAGDINPNNGKPRTHMSWQLQSGLDDTRALREHIEALLSILGTRAEAIRSLWVDYDIQLQCVGYYLPPGHGAHLDRECVRQAAQLGLAIDLDFYFVDAHEHG